MVQERPGEDNNVARCFESPKKRGARIGKAAGGHYGEKSVDELTVVRQSRNI